MPNISFWATVCNRPMLSDRCPVCLSVTLVHCGQTVGRIKIKLGMQIGLGPAHIVLYGDPAPPFSAHICCGQMAAWIKMPLGMEVGLGPGDFVLGTQPPPQKGSGKRNPQFTAHVYYSYCDFVRTLHSRYWFVQVEVLVLYAFYF